jgi:hypothetical protein
MNRTVMADAFMMSSLVEGRLRAASSQPEKPARRPREDGRTAGLGASVQ